MAARVPAARVRGHDICVWTSPQDVITKVAVTLFAFPGEGTFSATGIRNVPIRPVKRGYRPGAFRNRIRQSAYPRSALTLPPRERSPPLAALGKVG